MAAEENAPRSVRGRARSKPMEGPPPAPVPVLPPVQGERMMQTFFSCLGVGAALAFAGQLVGIPAVAIAGPIAMTLGYLWWGWQRGLARRPALRERFGDNVYYLGFVFTQVALFAAFVPPLFNPGHAFTTNEVMTGFGVAIGASMTGLIGRTLVVQLGHTPSENADILELGVEAMTRDFSTLAEGVSLRTRALLNDLDAVGRSLSTARESLSTELADWVAQTAATLRSYDEQLSAQASMARTGAASVEQATRQAETTISDQRERFIGNIGDAIAGLEALQSELRTGVGAALESVRASAGLFAETADLVRQAQQSLSQGVVLASQDTEAVRTTLEQATAAFADVSGLRAGVSELQGRLTDVSGEVAVLSDAAGELARTIEASGAGVAERLSSTAASAQATEHDVNALNDELSATVRALQAVLENFRAELRQARV